MSVGGFLCVWPGTCPGGICLVRKLSGGQLSPQELVHMGTCPPGTCPGGCPGGSCPPRNLSGGKLSPQEFVHGYLSGGKLSSHAIYQVIFLTGTRVGHCISSALWNVRGGIEYYSNSREAVWSCLCKRYWYQPATVEKSPCRNSDWEFAQSCTLHSHCTAEHWRSQTLSHEQGRGSKTPITLWFTDFFLKQIRGIFLTKKGALPPPKNQLKIPRAYY